MAEMHCPDLRVSWGAGRTVPAHTALGALLTAFRVVHNTWSNQSYVSDGEIATYTKNVNIMRTAWRAFSWKITPWVHWVLAHSVQLLTETRNLYLFSSIPTEARHKHFKRDLRTTCLRGRHASPRLAAVGLAHLLNKNALDKGLLLHHRKRKRDG